MASTWSRIQRAREAFVDVVLKGTPFYAQPMNYQNRHERRALAAKRRRGPRQNLKFVDDTKLPPLAADAGHIESKAPT